MNTTILIVDDEEAIRHFVGKFLEDEGFTVVTAATGGEAISLIGKDLPDVVLLDLKLPDMNGIDVLQKIKRAEPGLTVIMVTAYADVSSAVKAMKSGAFDYLNKPVNFEELLVVLDKALEQTKLWRELRHLRTQRKETFSRDFVRGRSPLILQIYEIVDQVAKSESTSVLIEGESGTGKELVANLIHEKSSRADKPFIEVNCAAIPRELLESELFGHEKGAFTDARSQKLGLLELANGGTLFLDEVGEMSLTIQVKLLRVLERMTFRRVGGTKDITVSVRIISATNQNLEHAVREGSFREDLYFRLKVVPIRVPPLRERKEDIIDIAKHFMLQFNRAFRKNFQSISPEAELLLLEYAWPGNIRELKNLFERTILLESGDAIQKEHIAKGLQQTGIKIYSLSSSIDSILSLPELPEEGIELERLLRDLEKSLIQKATRTAGGNQTKAAELLNIKRDRLRYRLKLHGIEK
ncbi:MAG: sigma-54 dependent transcriptional regulator [Candidatus Eisenbacteria bacterium]|nr:sigma-54 dependent transcriptional regulator [Candidatus Eisenbacteria bacterium]